MTPYKRKHAIELATPYIMESNPDIKLTPKELKDLFSIAILQTHLYLRWLKAVSLFFEY